MNILLVNHIPPQNWSFRIGLDEDRYKSNAILTTLEPQQIKETVIRRLTDKCSFETKSHEDDGQLLLKVETLSFLPPYFVHVLFAGRTFTQWKKWMLRI